MTLALNPLRAVAARSVPALLVLSVVVASCSGNGSATGSDPAPPSNTIHGGAAIWMHPLPDCSLLNGTSGSCSVDALALFSGTGEWPIVAQRVRVFGIYSSYPLGLSDSQLSQMIAFLSAHGMSFEIEAPALQATASCGNNVEGFAPSSVSLHDYTLTYLNRLKLGGANVAYVKMDEPLYFGSVSNEPNTCHLPVATVAQDVKQFVQLVHRVYPNAAVGDTEPVMLQANGEYAPDPVTAITQWWDAYQAASGSAFPFFVADMDFANPTWTTLANDLASSAHQRGLKFGIIYTGDYQDTSDAMWAGKAIARFEGYQGSSGGRPDFVLFQSWEPHPLHTLPETDDTTLSGVVNVYISAGG